MPYHGVLFNYFVLYFYTVFTLLCHYHVMSVADYIDYPPDNLVPLNFGDICPSSFVATDLY